ncbi:MAG: hypothetical protein Unbinned6486contig1001_9 [Prokaryotic dsDNA virus sp.]|nr:MAG: hypothetical protein Unbinned6486contig1001_9 [Prokaryotic dsDNA virus sp.]|tara:strand:+ start:24661 stop:24909 length:249 start_codon:yes stop_codon:yes gene_type:complete
MEYSITNKKAKNIKVDYIFKLDTLDNHLEECISIISPLLDVLPEYRHIYTPSKIEDYYGRLKRNYEVQKCKWKHREKLWQKK